MTTTNAAERKKIEAEFHNKIAQIERSSPDAEKTLTNKKYYAVARDSREFVKQLLDRYCLPGTTVLDYCCGRGEMTSQLAKRGAHTYGIDISPESVEETRQRLASLGLAERADIRVADAEQTGLPSAHFDVIVCSGVLHHLDLNHAYPELARLLKPTGRVIAIEALVHNPIIQAYRRLTPSLRTEWEVDHILGRSSITQSQHFFGGLEPHFFHLTDLLAVPFRKNTRVFDQALNILGAFDRALFRVPGLRWWAWQCIFILTQPKAHPSPGNRSDA